MRTNREYMIREIAGEKILIPTGTASQKLNGMIRLTDTAAFIWEQVDTAENLAEITARVCREFDIDEETAARCMDFCMNCISVTWYRTFRNWPARRRRNDAVFRQPFGQLCHGVFSSVQVRK